MGTGKPADVRDAPPALLELTCCGIWAPGGSLRPGADGCRAPAAPGRVSVDGVAVRSGVRRERCRSYASQGIELEFTKSVPSVHCYTGGRHTRPSPGIQPATASMHEYGGRP